jgi:hypothetical protein
LVCGGVLVKLIYGSYNFPRGIFFRASQHDDKREVEILILIAKAMKVYGNWTTEATATI